MRAQPRWSGKNPRDLTGRRGAELNRQQEQKRRHEEAVRRAAEAYEHDISENLDEVARRHDAPAYVDDDGTVVVDYTTKYHR